MPNTIESKKPEGSGDSAQSSREPTGLHKHTEQPVTGLLSRAQVAARLGVCPHTIQRLTRRGLLPALVFNRRFIRYTPQVVDAYIRSAMVGGESVGA